MVGTHEAPTRCYNMPNTVRAHGDTRIHASQMSVRVPNSPLFKLPPELRAAIYRFAVVEEGEIVVTKGQRFPEAPLLSTCKTIRSEAIGIFFKE